MFRLCKRFLAEWDGIYKILRFIVSCWRLDLEEIFSKTRATPWYCPNIIRITYLLKFFDSAFDMRQRDYSEFSSIDFCRLIQISWSRCHALREVVAMKDVSKTINFFLNTIWEPIIKTDSRRKMQYELK